MNALFKDAFQSGLISIRSDNLSIIVSPRLKKHKKLDSITKSWIVDSEGRKIITPHHCMPHKLFLEYHNDVILKAVFNFLHIKRTNDEKRPFRILQKGRLLCND